MNANANNSDSMNDSNDSIIRANMTGNSTGNSNSNSNSASNCSSPLPQVERGLLMSDTKPLTQPQSQSQSRPVTQPRYDIHKHQYALLNRCFDQMNIAIINLYNLLYLFNLPNICANDPIADMGINSDHTKTNMKNKPASSVNSRISPIVTVGTVGTLVSGISQQRRLRVTTQNKFRVLLFEQLFLVAGEIYTENALLRVSGPLRVPLAPVLVPVPSGIVPVPVPFGVAVEGGGICVVPTIPTFPTINVVNESNANALCHSIQCAQRFVAR